MRKTSRELSRLVAAEKQATPGFVPVLSLIAVIGDKKLKFIGKVKINADTFDFAGDNGKVKTFGDVDSFLRSAAKIAEKGDGVYTVSVDTGALLASSVPADIKTAAASKVVGLVKTKTAQNAVVVGLDSDLALMAGWETGNQAQQAKKAEAAAQRVAVVSDIAAIDAEVIRLNAIANS